MYQALYRKYRPQRFDQVVGQKHITDVLAYAVEKQNYSHAYLFCGSRGTGKTSCAKILAKAVNCLSPVNGSPCGKCEACRIADSGSATDIVEMDAASNNGVNDVRDIRDAVVYTPSVLKNRVFIIDEVHMLSVSAFNALLKTLEEPPANVVFILATTELQKLPATIISRCQRFDFRRISTADLSSHLQYIAGCEDMVLDDDAANALARLARGGMRDAISLLELNVRPDRHITLDSVRQVTGMVGRGEIAHLTDCIAHRRTEDIFSFVDGLYTSSTDIAVFWQDLISYYRDMLVVKTASDPKKYLDVTDDELKDLTRCAAAFTYPALIWQTKLLTDTGARLTRGSDSRVDAELTLIRMTQPGCDASPEALAARLQALEDRIAMGLPARAAVPAPEEEKTPLPETTEKKTAEAPQPASAPAPAAEKEPTNDWKAAGWFREVVRRMEKADPGKAAILEQCKAIFSPASGKIRIQLTNAFSGSVVDQPEIRATLLHLAQEFEPATDVVFELAEEGKSEDFSLIDELIDGADEI